MLIQAVIRTLEATRQDVEMLTLYQLTDEEQLTVGEDVEGYFRLQGEVLNCRDFGKVTLDHPLEVVGADLVFEHNGLTYAMWAGWEVSTLVQYTATYTTSEEI